MLREILRAKRDGGALSAEQCDWLMPRIGRGEIDEASLGALLASIWHKGMRPAELVHWTRAMTSSGASFNLSKFDAPKVDKHSTGGIGDKVSLPLAPILASLGCVVPMISGRGLEHTGGTLDKLEAVPGVRTGLSEGDVMRVLEEAGCVICAQTEDIAPADRVTYALRDRLELVASTPLIASSIVSKKLSEDLDVLVLDVKAGSGAFLVDPAAGRALARTMVELSGASGVRTSARITWMGRPLGRAAGHGLEIEETRALLDGDGAGDLVQITTAFAVDLLVDSGLATSEQGARDSVAEAIATGAARERFERMLHAQGASGAACAAAPSVHEYRAHQGGVLGFDDVREIGLAIRDLGGGRSAAADVIDPRVGVVWTVRAGERVDAGDVLAEVHHDRGRGLAAALDRIERGTVISDEAAPEEPLLVERILPSGRTHPA